MSPEAHFEVETYLRLSAADVAAAGSVRGAWYQAVRRFFATYDYFVLPSAQVFPFDAKTNYPTEIAGRATTDAYYRWMEAMVPVTMAGCPAVNVPAGSTARDCQWESRSWRPTTRSGPAWKLPTPTMSRPDGLKGACRQC